MVAKTLNDRASDLLSIAEYSGDSVAILFGVRIAEVADGISVTAARLAPELDRLSGEEDRELRLKLSNVDHQVQTTHADCEKTDCKNERQKGFRIILQWYKTLEGILKAFEDVLMTE